MPTAIALDAAIALLKRYRLFLIVGPLLIALGLSHCSDKRHTRQRDEARAELANALKASEANRQAAIAQVKEVEAKYAAQAKDNERDEANLRRSLGALAADYADRMRADKVCFRAAAAPSQGETAPVDHGPGADAIFLGRADYETLVGNTARLQAVHQWGQGLVEAGLAVPAQ